MTSIALTQLWFRDLARSYAFARPSAFAIDLDAIAARLLRDLPALSPSSRSPLVS
jgi:hypothetical protein